MSQGTNNGVTTNLTPADYSSEIGRLQFVINGALSGIRTAMPVKVVAVSNNGGVSPIGTVDVQPMVSMLDGSGNAWEHGIIHNVPYMRIQGGGNAIIIDPVIGDIGIATVCDRDISTVQKTKKVAAPGSLRKNDMSDMVYLMTIISSVAPTQYIQFDSSGIHIKGNVTIIGTLTNNGVNISSTHTHGGVQTGSGSSPCLKELATSIPR